MQLPEEYYVTVYLLLDDSPGTVQVTSNLEASSKQSNFCPKDFFIYLTAIITHISILV